MKLSDAFHQAIPEQPSTHEWGQQARRRVRRRRATIGAVAGIAVVAVAVPLALNMTGPGPMYASPEPSTPVDAAYPIVTYEMPECRGPGGVRVALTDLPDGKLPDGAERIWLCGGGFDASVVSDTELVGALDPLTTGVEEAVAAFNELNYLPGAAIGCAGDDSTYHVVVEYPGGETQVVRGFNTVGGCNHFQLADGIVEEGGQAYLDLLRDLWAQQRVTQPTEVPSPIAMCPAATSVWGIDPSTAVRGELCQGRLGKPLPAELLASIVEGIRTDAQPTTAPLDPDAQTLILANASGDPVTLRWQHADGAPALVWGWGEEARQAWHPDADTAAELDRLFAAPPPEPPDDPTAPIDPAPEPAVPAIPTDH